MCSTPVAIFAAVCLVIVLMLAVSAKEDERWSPRKAVSYILAKGNRAYFSHLFKYGGYRRGMEVGTAGNRFSELFLTDNPGTLPDWQMVEPFPPDDFWERLRGWPSRGIGLNTKITHHQTLSTNSTFLANIEDRSLDFIYLDGAHDYENVRQELPRYWPKVRPGGMLAGHDYCDHGETVKKKCRGCQSIPQCQPYTEYGVKHGKYGPLAKSQTGVIKAVQEWLETMPRKLHLHHTLENFTRASLAKDGFDYDLVITGTRNPSWFVTRPYSDSKRAKRNSANEMRLD